jgi:hypothetical protein
MTFSLLYVYHFDRQHLDNSQSGCRSARGPENTSIAFLFCNIHDFATNRPHPNCAIFYRLTAENVQQTINRLPASLLQVHDVCRARHRAAPGLRGDCLGSCAIAAASRSASGSSSRTFFMQQVHAARYGLDRMVSMADILSTTYIDTILIHTIGRRGPAAAT